VSNRLLELDITLALSRFDLSIQETQRACITGVFGASGTGKSSLLESIAGLRPARGSVRFGAKIWLDTSARRVVPPERRGIGYVPQDARLFPHLDVRGNLLAGAERAWEREVDLESLIREQAEALGIADLLAQMPSSLSGGERQRVALGRALCSAPRLLLLDEPFGALDTALRRSLLRYLNRVCTSSRAPVLLVSHDPVELCALCEDVWVIERGRVVRRGAPRDVLTGADLPENVLIGVMAPGADGVLSVVVGAVHVQVPSSTLEAGDKVVVVVRPDDVMLSLDEPRSISARNRLAANVVGLDRSEEHVLVELDLGPGTPPFKAELSRIATHELGLEPGKRVFVVFKASSCRVYSL
jgi:molybdate transport system ATP-binding protein